MPHRGPLPRRIRSSLGLLGALAVLALALAPALVAYGPPFPTPVNGQHVYDTAGVLNENVIGLTEAHISDIKAATGAEVAVYTQLVPEPWSNATTGTEARALMDQQGVGRKGIDDGLVIMFDMYEGNTCHGQVFLYGGSGYLAAYPSASDLQAIYENDAAMLKIVSITTPAHANELQTARQLNAILGRRQS